MKGILGRKAGMTEVFGSDGKLVPVTVIEVMPNVVTQIKTVETDGYEAIQLGYDDIKEKRSNKPEIGHAKKAGTTPKRFFKEIRGVELEAYTLGQEVKADLFEAGEMVDVTGISKGKGYQGVIKKNNQHRGPMAHGSKYHRGVGSLGTMRPMRVIPGKALPGHMGAEKVTIQNLEIIKVDLEDNCILVKGSVPGPKKGLVVIKSAVKTDKKNDAFELISYEEEVVEETAVEEQVENTEAVVEEQPVEEVVETKVEETETTEEPVVEETAEEVKEETEAAEEETTKEEA